MESASSDTSVTLLGRLREDQTDQQAWAAFADRYGPKVYAWCRHWRLAEADAEDVTRDVLAILARRMAAFESNPAQSFRAWLKTSTQHALGEFMTRRAQSLQASGDSQISKLLTNVPACEDLIGRLNAEFDREILEVAAARVRVRVKPHAWEAFRLTVWQGLSGADAARQLGLRVAIVFNAKSKVQMLLQEEIRKLDGAAGE
jgi:RNA polymerase sigma-70 factor (ECF subfamily)